IAPSIAYTQSGQETILPHAFRMMTLQDPNTDAWNMDTGASSLLNEFVNCLSDIFKTGNSILPTHHRPLHHNNLLITLNIVKKLIYVRQFVRDNYCTIEFDTFSFSIKDFMTRRVLLQCDSTRDLYPVMKPFPIPQAFLTSQHTWHQRLGHPGSKVLRTDIAKISRKRSKPDKHGHGKGKSA
ncbi:hypothetical protein Tco_0223516, partial [Tanacetum coccineum]